MYLFFGKGMIEYLAFPRYSNPKQELQHIVYLDANNVYGYAISQFLSVGGFQLVDPKCFTEINITAIFQNFVFETLILHIPKNGVNN